MAQEPDLTALDVSFSVVRRGYNQGQVDTHLRRLDAEMQILTTDRDAALDQSAQLARELDEARARAERLRLQVRSLATPPYNVQGMSDRMRSMLRLAEDEAAEMLSRAERAVEQDQRESQARVARMVATAQAEADALRASAQAEADRAAAQIAQARAELDAELRAGREQLVAEVRAAEERTAAARQAAEQQIATDRQRAEQDRTAAWAESETHRRLVEEDFTLAMNRRRSDSLAALTAERLRIRQEIDQMRESARDTARSITADAHRRVGELQLLRRRITEQLRDTNAALGQSLDALEPPADEAAALAEPTPPPASAPAHRPEPFGDPAPSRPADPPVPPALPDDTDPPARSESADRGVDPPTPPARSDHPSGSTARDVPPSPISADREASVAGNGTPIPGQGPAANADPADPRTPHVDPTGLQPAGPPTPSGTGSRADEPRPEPKQGQEQGQDPERPPAPARDPRPSPSTVGARGPATDRT